MSGLLRRLSRRGSSSPASKAMGDGSAAAGAATAHGKPDDGATCLATWDDITMDNYVEYQTMPSGQWLPCKFCSDTVEHMLKTQFKKYLDDVEKAAKDCAAAVRRLVNMGPPVFLSDANALPVPEGDTHVAKLWFAKSGAEVSARLEGALEGEARDKLWASQKETLAAMESAEAQAE